MQTQLGPDRGCDEDSRDPVLWTEYQDLFPDPDFDVSRSINQLSEYMENFVSGDHLNGISCMKKC